MNNTVWVAISFSMLVAAASSAEEDKANEQNIVQTESSVSLVSRLDLDSTPAFDEAKPCYARGL